MNDLDRKLERIIAQNNAILALLTERREKIGSLPKVARSERVDYMTAYFGGDLDFNSSVMSIVAAKRTLGQSTLTANELMVVLRDKHPKFLGASKSQAAAVGAKASLLLEKHGARKLSRATFSISEVGA